MRVPRVAPGDICWFLFAVLRRLLARPTKATVGVGKRYVSRIIRLAFLAPSIIEEIARGQQPPELTAQALSTRPDDLPLSWSAQRKLLGFEAPA